ncbi:hypothetical protein V6N13_101300 [Hibiscus sabdariffa]
MDHILCHCVTARGLWARVIHPELLVEFLHISFDVWLQCNLTSTYGSTYGDRWDSWFAIYCWLLWKDRCSVVLDSDHVPREDVLARGDRLVSECVSVLSSRLRNPTFDFIQPPQWSQPALGWVKGNVDALLILSKSSLIPVCIFSVIVEDRNKFQISPTVLLLKL